MIDLGCMANRNRNIDKIDSMLYGCWNTIRLNNKEKENAMNTGLEKIHEILEKFATENGLTIERSYTSYIPNEAYYTFSKGDNMFSKGYIVKITTENDAAIRRMANSVIEDVRKRFLIKTTTKEQIAIYKAFQIEKVIFNEPATIVFWKDGTKTIVKCGELDTYDPEKGLAMAISKKALGNQGNYFEVFKKWVPSEEAESENKGE